MLYTLRSGKTIDITFEQWLNMTDEDEEYLVSINHGDYIENPWRGSCLENTPEEADIWELPDVPEEVKLKDIDIDPELDLD